MGQFRPIFADRDAVIPPPPLVCPDGYSYNAGLCYRWTQTLTSALEANDDCISDGATLALPRSQDEHDYLTGLISETVLIGITDVLHEGTWKYSDGTEIGAFNKFLPEADYPNTGTIDCVVMSKDDSYMWKPSSCSQEQYGYVCQKDADMTKLPQLECPTGYTGVEGTKCYRVVPEPDSAISALAECQAEGADAVLPTSDLEHYYLKSLGLGTHWIGVSDAEPRSTEGNWVYLTTGLPPLGSFNRWGSTANTDDLDCVAMDSTEAYQWAPTYCLDDLACVCQKAPPDQCPPLLAPANGAVSGSSLPEGVATFTCDEGYNLDGASTTTCQADLSWSNDSPTCNIVQCPLITVQAPVILSSGGSPYSYQDEVTFSCADGYTLDGAASVTCQASGTWSDVAPTCNDIDGCAGDPCDANAACADVAAPGTGQDCTCNTGYEGDGYTCTDIDGCTGDPCDANAACADVAAPGTGQDCTCNTGYEGDGYTCTDIDGCDPNPCDANAACADVAAPGTGQDCTCNTGYEGDGYTCTDIDGCAGDPCDANAACVDVAAPGTGQDCTCNTGYTGDGYTCTADSGSECDPNPCLYGGTCLELSPSGYSCQCRSGYIGDNCQIGCNIQHPNFPADRFAIDSENRCYWFSRYSDKAKQASAEKSCIDGGGKLVRVRTAAKQQFLVDNIAKFGLRTYWIGLDDKGKGREKKFRWSDGTNYDTISGYHNWRFGSFPRKHKYRDCVAISRVRSEWVVLHCKKAGHPYICEMDTTLPNP